MRRFATTTLKATLIILVIASGWLLVSNFRQINDWWVLRDYQPSERIVALATESTMTPRARQIFYRSDPQINANRSDLARNCRIYDEKTIELGCYLSTQKIYLLDIQQPELTPEMPVTAAHEMLHAAYDRLGSSERQQLSRRLNEVYAGISDQAFRKRVAEYGDLSADELSSELHSILGTEYESLPGDLEDYYLRYFSNRQQVVGFSQQFNAAFDGLRTEISNLDAQIKTKRSQMNAYLSRGQVGSYNSLVPSINQDIERYNAKVDQYNLYASSLLGRAQAPAAQ